MELTLGTPADSDFAREWTARGHSFRPLPLQLHQGLRVRGSTRRPGPLSVLKSAFGVGKGLATLARVAREYDLMYSFSLQMHLETVLAGRLTGTPTALDLVDIVEPGIGRRVLRAAASLATLTVANSHATAVALGDEKKVQVIHPGIDLRRFIRVPGDTELRRELAGGSDVPLVAVVGRLDVKKGIHVLLEAMSLLAGEAARARLIVVGTVGTGPPEYAERLHTDADRLLAGRVRFLGRRSDIAEILRVVDVLVVASPAEPFGLTALEAQASGTPVIGTTGGGIPEFVVHEKTGLLVPPNDPSSLADALTRMLSDATLREQLVDEAERCANPARGVEAQLDEIADMYRRVAQSRKKIHAC